METAGFTQGQAMGMLGHLLALIALNRECGRTVEQLAEWQVTIVKQHGFYSEQAREPGYGLEKFVENYVAGRKLIYREVEATILEGTATIRTRLWFVDDLPDAFFYFDVSLNEFRDYVCALARQHASASGFSLIVEHKDGIEMARVAIPENQN